MFIFFRSRRNRTSDMANTRTTRYSFTKIAPSTESGCAVFTFILVSIVLLGVTLLPQIFIYKTDFTGSNVPVSIGNSSFSSSSFQGVTNITWGTWLACVSNANSTTCTQRDWINNPYTFTIENADNVHVTVQQFWPRVLFLQLIGVMFAVFIVFVLLVRVCCLNMQSERTSYVDPGKEKACNTANLLTASLCVWITIVVICNVVVLYSIHKEMQSLGTGVKTTPALGFWMPVAADLFILIASILVIRFIKYKVAKSKEVVLKYRERKTEALDVSRSRY